MTPKSNQTATYSAESKMHHNEDIKDSSHNKQFAAHKKIIPYYYWFSGLGDPVKIRMSLTFLFWKICWRKADISNE